MGEVYGKLLVLCSYCLHGSAAKLLVVDMEPLLSNMASSWDDDLDSEHWNLLGIFVILPDCKDLWRTISPTSLLFSKPHVLSVNINLEPFRTKIMENMFQA
jgi:hypothetical protein